MKKPAEKTRKEIRNVLLKRREMGIENPRHRELLEILAEIIAHDIVEKK